MGVNLIISATVGIIFYLFRIDDKAMFFSLE